MNITRHSGIYTLSAIQILPITLPEAWDYFSNPQNLEKITPPSMRFRITSALSPKVYEGQIITYKVNVLPGIRTNWVTEITRVRDGEYFIDEQRIGPYKMWHHEHHFRDTGSGIEMIDKVSFAIPFGFLGHLAYKILIKKQLISIFNHRKNVLNLAFPMPHR